MCPGVKRNVSSTNTCSCLSAKYQSTVHKHQLVIDTAATTGSFSQNMLHRCSNCSEHPGINSDRRCWIKIQVRRVWNKNIVVHAIEAERLPNSAGGKCCAVLQCAVVAVLNIVRVPIRRPPADHIRR